MSPAIPPLLLMGLFAAFVGFTLWTGVRRGKRSAQNIRQLADALGLHVTENAPTLGLFYAGSTATGQLRGKEVTVFPFMTGSGKSRVQWCAVAAKTASAAELTFHLQRQGLGTKFMALFGAKEIQVGDEEFDRTWFIETNQPDFFRTALLPEIREKISSLVRELGTQARGMEFKRTPGRVQYAEKGSFANGDSCKRCVRAADIVCDLADLAEVFAEQARGR